MVRKFEISYKKGFGLMMFSVSCSFVLQLFDSANTVTVQNNFAHCASIFWSILVRSKIKHYSSILVAFFSDKLLIFRQNNNPICLSLSN